MTTSRSRTVLVLLASIQLFSVSARAHTPAEEMTEAAQSFLASLTPEQSAKAIYEMKHDERLNWDYVPRDRAGLPFKAMTSAQRALGHALLATGLSQRGYAKAVTIMSLDQILFDLEKGNPRRDPELYYITIFGKPSLKEPWGFRVEGHHVSVNFTVVSEKEITSAPLFLGSNPGDVKDGPRKGLRVLGDEEELGFALVHLLTDDQKRTAIFSNTPPRDIVTGKAHKVSPLSPDGLAYEKMSAAEQKGLQQVVSEYAHRLRNELADDDLKRIAAAGWGKVHFAWAGSTEHGEGHYYRVQGPTFLLEFDNTQGNANHIHSVWRDLENDFGGDLLKRHYEQVPHEK